MFIEIFRMWNGFKEIFLTCLNSPLNPAFLFRCAGGAGIMLKQIMLKQIMSTHLRESLIPISFFASQDLTDGRFHVVVYSPLTASTQKLKSFDVSIKHHLQFLTRVSTHNAHPTITKRQHG